MFQLKLKETVKLHYGQYVYKVGLYNNLAGHFRTELQRHGKLSWAKQKIDELNSKLKPNDNYVEIPRGRFQYSVPVKDFYDAINLYRILMKNDTYKIRVEVNYIYIYTNDREFCTSIINTCDVKEFWEPNPNKIDALSQEKNIILVNKPPEYEYKITLGKKLGKPALAHWIDKNPKLAKIGETAKHQCLDEGWVKGYYFFVKNSQALLMAELIVGDNISRLEKLVYVPD